MTLARVSPAYATANIVRVRRKSPDDAFGVKVYKTQTDWGLYSCAFGYIVACMTHITIIRNDAPSFCDARIDARRDDALACIIVTITSAWDTDVFIRDDMNLRVQCDLMFADACVEHMPIHDVAHVVDVTHDVLLSMRDAANVVDPDNTHA